MHYKILNLPLVHHSDIFKSETKMENTLFTRKELYNLVWSQPLTKISEDLNISAIELKKVLIKMNVPIPENGYWSKLKYNKPVTVKELPGSNYELNEINFPKTNSEIKNIASPTTIKNSILEQYGNLNQRFFKVQGKLTNPDILTIEAQKNLSQKSPSDFYYSGGHQVITNSLNLKAFPDTQNRALRFFDSIIKLLRFRNHDVIVNNTGTYAKIDGIEINMSLREKMRMERVPDGHWMSTKYHPTGILIFKIDKYPTKEFIDDKIKIDEKLPTILAELEYRAIQENEEIIKRKKKLTEENEAKRIALEKKEMKDLEIQKFKNLLTQVETYGDKKIDCQ